MPTQDDVRQICTALPGAVAGEERFGFSVLVKGKSKGFVWEWSERVHPKKPKMLNPSVMAILVPGLHSKEILLASGTAGIFTEDHYNGFPAVLVRLEDVELGVLTDLLIEAWRCKASTSLQTEYDARDEQAKKPAGGSPNTDCDGATDPYTELNRRTTTKHLRTTKNNLD